MLIEPELRRRAELTGHLGVLLFRDELHFAIGDRPQKSVGPLGQRQFTGIFGFEFDPNRIGQQLLQIEMEAGGRFDLSREVMIRQHVHVTGPQSGLSIAQHHLERGLERSPQSGERDIQKLRLPRVIDNNLHPRLFVTLSLFSLLTFLLLIGGIQGGKALARRLGRGSASARPGRANLRRGRRRRRLAFRRGLWRGQLSELQWQPQVDFCARIVPGPVQVGVLEFDRGVILGSGLQPLFVFVGTAPGDQHHQRCRQPPQSAALRCARSANHQTNPCRPPGFGETVEHRQRLAVRGSETGWELD